VQNRYDIQQVCENGHQISCCYNIRPEEQKKFCPECGAPTITACLKCNLAIQGAIIESYESWDGRHTMRPVSRPKVPSYCSNCGEPYPWTQKKIQTAIQIFAEFGDLNEKEQETIEQDIKNIAKDLPEAELSARRIKRIWDRGKSISYEAIMEFASRTAAKILNGQ